MGLLVLRVAGAPKEHHQQTQGPCQQNFQTGNDVIIFSLTVQVQLFESFKSKLLYLDKKWLLE